MSKRELRESEHFITVKINIFISHCMILLRCHLADVLLASRLFADLVTLRFPRYATLSTNISHPLLVTFNLGQNQE